MIMLIIYFYYFVVFIAEIFFWDGGLIKGNAIYLFHYYYLIFLLPLSFNSHQALILQPIFLWWWCMCFACRSGGCGCVAQAWKNGRYGHSRPLPARGQRGGSGTAPGDGAAARAARPGVPRQAPNGGQIRPLQPPSRGLGLFSAGSLPRILPHHPPPPLRRRGLGMGEGEKPDERLAELVGWMGCWVALHLSVERGSNATQVVWVAPKEPIRSSAYIVLIW